MDIRLFAGLSRVVAMIEGEGYVIPLSLDAQAGNITIDSDVWRVVRPHQLNIDDCQVSSKFIALVLRNGQVHLFVKENSFYQNVSLIQLPPNILYRRVYVAESCCVARDADGHLWLLRQGSPVRPVLAGKRVTSLVSWEGTDIFYAVVEQQKQWALYRIYLERSIVHEEHIAVFTHAVASLNLSDQYLYIHYINSQVQRWNVAGPRPVLDSQWHQGNISRVITGRGHVLFVDRSGTVSQIFHRNMPINRSMSLDMIAGSYIQCVAGFDITVLINRAGEIRICGRLNSVTSIDRLLSRLEEQERIRGINNAIAQCHDKVYINNSGSSQSRTIIEAPTIQTKRHVLYDGQHVTFKDVEVEGQPIGYIPLSRWLEKRTLDERIQLMKLIVNCITQLRDLKYDILDVSEDILVGDDSLRNQCIQWQLGVAQSSGTRNDSVLDMDGFASILWRIFTLRTPYQVNRTEDSDMRESKTWPYADTRISGDDGEVTRVKTRFASNESYDDLYGLFYQMFHGTQSYPSPQLESWQRVVSRLSVVPRLT